ncbi:MAG: hypothetical protein IKI30_02110 [Oxalobacter sp.]|nr:hypothetical protein [Oxalobacter sp.]
MLLETLIKSLVVAGGMCLIGFLIGKFRDRKKKPIQEENKELQPEEKKEESQSGNNMTITIRKSWFYILVCGFVALIVYNIYLSKQIIGLKDDILNVEEASRDSDNDLHKRLIVLELGINPRYEAYRKRKLDSD